MATIKLQPSGAVVIKDGKVACGCCLQPDCCPYPAQALEDELYTVDDLPDQVTVGGVVLSKQEDAVGENDIFYSDGPNDIQFVGYLWLLDGPLTEDRTFESSCLIAPYIFIPFDEFDPPRPPILVEDQFADTYTVNGPTSGTVTRKSDCVWQGTGLKLTNFEYQWKVNGNNKIGFQNTPVGSYGGGYTVS